MKYDLNFTQNQTLQLHQFFSHSTIIYNTVSLGFLLSTFKLQA